MRGEKMRDASRVRVEEMSGCDGQDVWSMLKDMMTD